MLTILITGVSTGIGRACAERFARSGWRVIGTVRDTDAFPDGIEGCDRLERFDLAVPGDATRLAERVLSREGCPDALLNNAGMVQFGPLEGIDQDELVGLYQVNVFGQLELIRALAPAMRERGSGVIANVTSLGGRITFPFFAGYNSTKWALEGASEGLWHELKPFGIRVKAIEPGFVQTAIWGKALPGEDSALPGPAAYAPFLRAMLEFEGGIGSRTSPADTAREVFSAVTDASDRLRYPVSAYARPIVAARRWLGDRALMRFFHSRWMGPNSG